MLAQRAPSEGDGEAAGMITLLAERAVNAGRSTCESEATRLGPSQVSREDENSRWVPANDGMEPDAAVLGHHDLTDTPLLVD